jgi:hypothetical protein
VLLLIVLLIVFMVATLGLLGYIAWQRGLIDLPQWRDSQLAASSENGQEADAGAAVLSPYDEVLLGEVRGLRRNITPIVEQQAGLHEELKLTSTVPGQGTQQLQPEQLERLAQLEEQGRTLLELYRQFTDEAIEISDPDLLEYLPAIAEEFGATFELLTEHIGVIYGSHLEGSNPAYLLPDEFKTVLADSGWLSPQLVEDAWAQAREQRHQLRLDTTHAEEIRQLRARNEALKEIHRAYQEQLNSLGGYRVRAGSLSKSGRDALTLLDGLAFDVEELVLEFEGYRAGLEEMEQSDSMKRLQNDFIALAQQDHMFCFSEICRLSVDDKELEHEAYGNLPEHYQFVEQTWPALQMDYMKVYEESERDWRAKWQ